MADVLSKSRWVFGYGSLIWNPGFRFVRAVPAHLKGAHRKLCVYSTFHRGTEDEPGLVFGLLAGGSCRGLAFEVAQEDWLEALGYLRIRELQELTYRESWKRLTLDDGSSVEALTFMADPAGPRFAGRLENTETLRVIARSSGRSGSNLDYVLNTERELTRLGLRDRHLGDLVGLLA